jgi:hypothetical protein
MDIQGVSHDEKLTDLGIAEGSFSADDGTRVTFPRIVIPKTLVHRVQGRWWVDACAGLGLSESGDKIRVAIPREPCGLSLEYVPPCPAALSVPYSCVVVLSDGRQFQGDVIPPDCPLHLLPLYAEPLDMSGELQEVSALSR